MKMIKLIKNLKSYKKDLNNQFKNKIDELKELTLDQEKFNALISELISDMSLDENIDEEEKNDDDNKKEDKQSISLKIKNKEQKEKDGKHEEMVIEWEYQI